MSLLFFLYSLTSPFQEYGIRLTENLSINPFFFLPIIYLALAEFKVYKKNLIIYLIFLFALLFPRLSISPQTILLIAFSVPIYLVKLNEKYLKITLKGLEYITILTCFIVIIEVVAQILLGGSGYLLIKSLYYYNFDGAVNLFNNNFRFLGFTRPFAFFEEPSHLAIFLNFSNVIFCRNKFSKYTNWKRLLIYLSIFLTGTLTGMVLLIGFELFERFSKYSQKTFFKDKNSNLIINKNSFINQFSIISILFISPIYLFLTEKNRTSSVIRALKFDPSAEGSEASRINFLYAISRYLESDNNILFGLGLDNMNQFLIGSFSENGLFGDGKIPNMFVSLLISFGIIGSLLILISFILNIKQSTIGIDLPIYIFFILVAISIGNLYNSYVWQPSFILINLLYFNKKYRINNLNVE